MPVAISDDNAVAAAVVRTTQQVPFLSREREAVHGQAVVLEALQALYNICFFHKRVHLEVAATSGIVPHLCRSELTWRRALFELGLL